MTSIWTVTRLHPIPIKHYVIPHFVVMLLFWYKIRCQRFWLVSFAILQMAMLSLLEIVIWRRPSHYVWGLFPNWWLLTSMCKCLLLSPSPIATWPQAWYQRVCHMMLKAKYSSGREVMGGDFWAEVWPAYRATHTSLWQNGTFQDREVN